MDKKYDTINIVLFYHQMVIYLLRLHNLFWYRTFDLKSKYK